MHQLKKTLSASHVPKMTKALRRAITKSSQLETKSVRSKTSDQNKKIFHFKLYQKIRGKYHEKLNSNKVIDNKEFLKTIKPFLSHKVTTFPKVSLMKN